ncbi:MAG: TPM domain-containing protein [Bacillota bacterium]|nr:TPM domain-containing protein [Bacillota bacterium]
MKRTIFPVLLALILSLILCGLALAAEPAENTAPADAAQPMLISEPAEGEDIMPNSEEEAEVESLPLDYVTDDAFILSNEALYDLNQRAAEASETLEYGIYIITVTNHTHLELEAGEMEDLTECAAAIYEEYELGYGPDKNGLLLMISVETQEYAIVDHGNITFSDHNKVLLADTFIPAFAAESWYDGFRAYLEGINQVVPAARENRDLESIELNPDGEALPAEEKEASAADGAKEGLPENYMFYVGIGAATLMVIALVVILLVLRSKRKKQEKKSAAKKK